MAVSGVFPISEIFDLDDHEPNLDETPQGTITVCGVPLILKVFDLNDDDPDFDVACTFGLHLGALRRFARLDRPKNPVSDEPASER